MRVLLLALLPACSLYFGSSHSGSGSPSSGGGGGGDGATYDVAPIKSMAGTHGVAGVDGDRNGGLWIAYQDHPSDYYGTADVWIDHLDASGNLLSEWHYADDYTSINGLAFTGDALWLNYNELGTCQCHLRKIDPTTGAIVGRFATESGYTSIGFDGTELLLSYAWSEIRGVSPTTGSIAWTVSTPIGEGGTQRGIAYQDARTWIATYWTNELYVVDTMGKLVGSAFTDLLPGDPGTDMEDQLAWVDATTLVVVVDNQINWLAVHPR